MTVVASGQLTIIDVNDGVDGLSVIVSNESHALSASSTGAVSSYVGSGTTIQVFEGSIALTAVTTLTANGQFTIGTPTQNPASTLTVGAVTYSGTTATVAQHSAMTTASTSVVITYPITIRRANGTTATISKVQTITKAKAGTDGTGGTRGSRRFYLSNHTAWSNVDATTAASEDGGPVNQDVVTQYGTGFTETRYYNKATTSWVSVAEVIDGNLLVDGSVLADKIDTKGLSIKDAAGNVIFSAGNAVEYTNYVPFKTWEFRNSLDGWTATNASLTTASDAVTLTASANDPQLQNTTMSIDGTVFSRVRVRMRRLAGTGWEGRLHYRTSGATAHSFTQTYSVVVGAPIGTDWVTLEWNMSGLTDWTSSTITGMRLDLGLSAADQFEIDWVSVGKLGVGGNLAGLDQITEANASTYIASAAIGDAQIKSLSAAKLTAGTIAVDQYVQSTSYSAANKTGWKINGNGDAEFNNATVRGTVYATNGQFWGTLLGGEATAYGTGKGFYAGGGTSTDATNYRWRVGDPAGARIQWSGTGVEVYNGNNQLTLSSGGFSQNLVANSDFEVRNADTNAPGGYIIHNANGAGGGWVESFGVSGFGAGVRAGTGTGMRLGITTATTITSSGVTGGVTGGWQANTEYTIAFYAKKVNGLGFTKMQLLWNYAPTSQVAIENPTLATEYQRYVFRVKWDTSIDPDVQTSGTLWPCVLGTVAANDEIHFDRIMAAVGAVTPNWTPALQDSVGPYTKLTTSNISNYMNTAAIGSAYINDLSATKLTAGTIAVDQYIQSTSYSAANKTGWKINGNGDAEFNNATVRGTVYATNGQFWGTLLGGAATAFNSGLGFYAGGGSTGDGTNYRWRVGNPSGARIQWTGSAVEVYGSDGKAILTAGSVVPTNTNQLTDGAGLGTKATWDGVTGTGKPADNATVGAPTGTYVGGTLAETVASNAASGQSAYDTVNSSTSGLATKLSKASSEILNIATSGTTYVAGLRVGDITWDASGNRTSGKGLALTPKGIVGHNGTATTFTVGVDGNATFAGSLSAARISVGSSANATKFFEDGGNGMSLLSAAYAVYSNPGTLTTTGGLGTVVILTTGDGTLTFKRNDANHAIERRLKNASIVFKVSCSAVVDDQLSVWWRFDGGTWYHLYGLSEPQARDAPVSFTYTGVLAAHPSSTVISTVEFGFAPCNSERYTYAYDKLYIKNLALSVEFFNF